MNFKKLQAMQEELDNAILSKKAEMTAEERFNKTLVALSVEVSEIANCSEHFKFWKDNKGKVDENRFVPDWDYGGNQIIGYYDYQNGMSHQIRFEQAHKLTLVEECSDALHFILSLANQTGVDFSSEENKKVIDGIAVIRGKFDYDIEEKYLSLSESISSMSYFLHYLGKADEKVLSVLEKYLRYIKLLGVTEEELEQAYYDKNEIIYKRLREGY